MTISIGSDHRGFPLKEQLKPWLAELGYLVKDFGTDSGESVDYPVFALAVARDVAARQADLGILICSSGVGVSIAANKVKGIRAALVFNEVMAARAREHNNANVLCLGADFIPPARAKRIVRAWLTAKFAGGRHQRRLTRIARAEREY